MLTHHTKSLPARCSCVSRPRVHSRRRMMFRSAGCTRSGTARARGEVTHPLQWSSEIYDADLALIYYKTPDGCKGGWTCAKHAPGGRGAEGRLRVKTPDGCKGGWTCAKHAPRRGEASMGRGRIKTADGCKAGWTCAQHAPRRGEASMGRGRINYLMVGVSISDGFTREGPKKEAYKPMKKARIFEEGANGIIKTAILHGSVEVLGKIMKVYDECTQGGVKLSEKESYVSIN